jgi:hypothetical protein
MVGIQRIFFEHSCFIFRPAQPRHDLEITTEQWPILPWEPGKSDILAELFISAYERKRLHMSALVAPGGQRVLTILAHPDDEESFTGGTMARLAQEGKEITSLVATRGEKGSDERTMTPERLAAIREEEQREAARLLGVQRVLFLEGYSDGYLEASFKLREELVRKIRELKPDVVFTFDP